MNELKEWIEDGINIRKTNDGYQVFTIPTQHFEIKELADLTPDKFKEMVQRQEQLQELENQLLLASFGEWVDGELFKDLFND